MAQPNIRKNTQTGSAQTVEVLYQKMGDRWFAFSLIDDEVFVGSIPVEKLQELEQQDAEKRSRSGRTFRLSGNS
jgi:hypothetical protein